jgi:1-deoxy-D-xylulose-5-phosphate reductoisomerase
MVQFEDGAVKAQLGVPDMRLPIQYAFSYPQRLKASFDRLDFSQMKELTFERPDTDRFPCLDLAFDALRKGGNMPCIVNAANEIVNRAFIEDRITYNKISEVIASAMQHVDFSTDTSLDTYLKTDMMAREYAKSLIS